MTKTIQVEGIKTFKITVPDEAKITFGPWSPGEKSAYGENSKGTLRVYENKTAGASILGVWSGVKTFRVLDGIEYEEKTSIETGSTVWKSDKKGYHLVQDIERDEAWDTDLKQLNEAMPDESENV